MLSATPRFPEDDSTRTDAGVRAPVRSAASTISAAAFSLIDPAKLNPSHFRNSGRPRIDRRSTYRWSSLNACGTDMTVTTGLLIGSRQSGRPGTRGTPRHGVAPLKGGRLPVLDDERGCYSSGGSGRSGDYGASDHGGQGRPGEGACGGPRHGRPAKSRH